MLGPMGARIIDLLKIMTPNEIDKYVEKKEETSELKLAAGAEEFDVTKSPPKVFKNQDHSEDQNHNNEEDLQHEAKIIPLHKGVESEVESTQEDTIEASDHEEEEDSHYAGSKSEQELEKAGIFSANKIKALQKEKLKRYKAKQESTSNFILNQREKLKRTKLRLIEQDAIKNYSQNASVEKINNEIDIDNPDEEKVYGNKGILVNKKHY